MRRNSVKALALGGMLSAVSLVIMCLGGLIPLATFICPVLAILTGHLVYCTCGRKIAWCWYGVVAILSALLAPDKEAAAVFVFLGYYPIIKSRFDSTRFGWIGKFLLLNCAIAVMYWLLLNLFKMDHLVQEFDTIGIYGTIVALAIGNVTFFLVDRILGMLRKKR